MKRFPRFFLTVILLCAAVVLAGSEVVRLRAEQGLSRFLGIPVRVQRVTFSPRRLTLHNISFQFPVQSPLRIERLRIEGWSLRSVTLTGLTLSVAGVPLRAEGKVFLRSEPGKYAEVDGTLNLEHPMMRGTAEVTGRLLEPVVFGWVETDALGQRRFVAKLDLSREAIGLQRLEIQDGWTATGSLAFRRPSWRGELSVIGPDSDRFRFRIEPGEKASTRAMLWVYPEGGPSKEFFAQWAVRRKRLEFEAQLLGRQGVLKGQTDLRFPYRTAAALDLFGLDLAELSDWIPGQSSSNLSGKVRGRVEVTALLGRITSKGELISEKGRFGRMDFDQIAVRFEGKGPMLRIGNSHLARRGTLMLMEGVLDARRIGRPDFFRLVKLTPAPGREGSLDLGNLAIGPTAGEGFQVQTSISSEQSVKINLEKEERVIAVEHRKRF